MGYVETASRVSGDSTGTQVARIAQRENAADSLSDEVSSSLSDVCVELDEEDSSAHPRAPERTDLSEWRASVRPESDRAESSFFSIAIVALFVCLLMGAFALLHRLRPRGGEHTAG